MQVPFTPRLVFTGAYIVGSVYLGMPHWCFGIGPQGIGVVGMLIHFGVTLVLTPLTSPPSAQVRALIDSIIEQGYARQENADLLTFVATVDDIFPALAKLPSGVSKVDSKWL